MRFLLTAFIFGLAAEVEATTCDGNHFLKYPEQYQITYVAGAWDMLELSTNQYEKCIGTSVKMSQLSDALKQHFYKNPQ